jgi:hypothetical protein
MNEESSSFDAEIYRNVSTEEIDAICHIVKVKIKECFQNN